MLKYKYIFQIKYNYETKQFLNSTRKLLWFEINKMLTLQFKKINLL